MDIKRLLFPFLFLIVYFLLNISSILIPKNPLSYFVHKVITESFP